MMHGRKREPKKQLSEEEIQEQKTKLEKILLINQAFLTKRLQKEYD